MLTPTSVDPVTLEVIRSGMPAIANEMAYDLQRTSYNMMIYEVHDFCCTILDAEGRLYAQNRGGVSHFVSDMSVVIRDGLKRYGIDGFEPGDVIIMNHPAVCGQHLNNVVCYSPFFVKGKLAAFTAVRAHWVDVGGLSTGTGADTDSFDPWCEGLHFDQIKVYKAGQPQEEMIDFIRTNVRFPDESMGDMRSQIAACVLGQRRLTEMYERYGETTVTAAMHEIFAQSERKARAAIAEIPDGVYEAESLFDYTPAGGEPDPLRLAVRVVVDGSDMEIDFSDCPPQHSGPMNSRTLAGAYIPYKALTAPEDAANEGTFSALKVTIPEGNLMMATYPAPMANWSNILSAVVDTVLKAVSPAIPDRIPAGHIGYQGLARSFMGDDPQGGRFVIQTLDGGGWGGRPFEDGPSGTVTFTQGDVRNAPIEALELKSPVIVEERALRPDSGGPGEFRGGLGISLTIRPLVGGRWGLPKDRRTQCPPWGMQGGQDGRNGSNWVKEPGDTEWTPFSAVRFAAQPGVTIRTETVGGGGFGDPRKRDPESVRSDVLNGYVSVAGAAADYGVVVIEPGLAVDLEATKKLRAT